MTLGKFKGLWEEVKVLWRRLMKQEPKEKPVLPNALVLDPVEGFGLENIKDPKGHLWLYGERRVHLLKRKGDKLEAVVLPDKMEALPEQLYRALSWDKETKVLFTVSSSLLDKFNTFGAYVLIGILLFFIFIIFGSL